MRWRPFELNPDMPREGMNRQEYRRRKFGDPRRILEMDRRMTAIGAEEGIPFALDRIAKTPNTFDAHRLIWLAHERGAEEAVVEALFRAFFTEGRDIGDRAVLAGIGGERGLGAGAVAAFLAGAGGSREVRDEERRAQELGVDAVPFFVIGGRLALAGAQPPEAFLRSFGELTAEPPDAL